MLPRPREWRYGYDLAKEVGLQSGTLYPLLMRLTDEGMLESEWLPPARGGAPARHAYRLTNTGLAFANAFIESRDGPSRDMGLAPA
jgi:DNA-binding PadR family transcriptional regulator